MTIYKNVPPLKYDPSKTAHDTPLPNYLQREVPNNMKWVKDWRMSDEFNAFPVKNWYYNKKWVRYNSLWQGRHPSFFSEDNVYVRDNRLWLQSTERAPNAEDRRKMGRRLDGDSWKYATSFIRTAEKRKYGYYEIACKLMDSNVSCAFWFIDDRDTEIDVFEYSTSRKNYDIYDKSEVPFNQKFNMNTIVYSGEKRDQVRANPLKINVGRDLSKEIIKVGLLWKPDVLVWYLNDREVRRLPNNDFHIPLFLQLDSEVFPNWFGEPGEYGPKRLPNSWQVFYVRSYQMARK
ncbi:Glycoside hydrolase 16 [Gracilaria domingensis]|nr:Glycoside hydrolase 16 [Gracilaria domingensis]